MPSVEAKAGNRRGTAAITRNAVYSTPSTPTTATGGANGDEAPAVAGRLARTIRVDGRPNGVVVAGGLVGVIRSRSTRVLTFRPKTGKRAPYRPKVGSLPAAAAALSGRLFVGNQGDATLSTIGLRSHKPIGSPLSLPVEGGYIVGVSAGERGVWVGSRAGAASGGPHTVSRIDPVSNTRTKDITLPDGIQNLTVGAGAVWVISRNGRVLTRVSVSTGARRQIPVGDGAYAAVVGEGSVWVTNSSEATVRKISTRPPYRVQRTIRVGRAPKGIDVGGGSVWIANSIDNTLTRLDAKTGDKVGRPVRVGHAPFAVSVRGHAAWVTLLNDNQVARVRF